MGKKSVKDRQTARTTVQDNTPEPEESEKPVEEGVTAQYVGKRILFYVAGGNPIIENFIMNYLLDFRCGLMILGLALGSLFSQWLDSVLPPKQK